jgi:sensor histidine kinase YesM
MPSRQGTLAVVRATLAQAPEESRRPIVWLFAASAGMIALQIWDVSGRSGPGVVAELVSVLLAVPGVMLLGMTAMLNAGGAAAAWPDRERLTPLLRALPLLGFMAGVLLSAAIALFFARALLGLHLLRFIVPAAIMAAMLYAAWVTVRNATNLLHDHAERTAAQAARAEAELAGARMRELQARMQPHFLFNALNTVADLVRTDPAAAEATVEDLAAILRASLKHGATSLHPLRDELALVRALAGVEQRRLGDRLRVRVDVDPAALDVPVPALSIQPLVENAIKHGIAPRLAGGSLVATIAIHGETVTATVSDDGDGFARGWTEGTGLGNLRERLRTLYGDRACVTVHPGPGGRVSIALPVRHTA